MLFTLSIILKNHMIWSESASTAEFHVGRSAQRVAITPKFHLDFVHW